MTTTGRRVLGAIVGGMLPVLGLVGAAMCDEQCGTVVEAPLGVLYLTFVVFPGIFVQQQGWLTLAVIVGFWASVGAMIGGALGGSRASSTTLRGCE